MASIWKKIALFAGTILLSGQSKGYSEKNYELIDLINHALSKNPAIQQARSEKSMWRYNLYDARSKWLPSLNFEGRYYHSRDLEPGTLPDQRYLQGSLRAVQPIFEPQRLYETARAGHSLNHAEQQYQQVFQDLLFEISTHYFECSRLQQERHLVDSIAQDVAAERSSIEQMVKLGVATQIDMLNAKMQISSLKLEEFELRKQHEFSLENLRRMSQLDIQNCPLKLVLPLGEQIAAIQDQIPGPNNKTPSLQMMGSRVEQAKTELSFSRHQWLPSVSLFSQADLTHSQPLAQESETWTKHERTSFGVTVNWQLGVDKALRQKSRYQAQLAAVHEYDELHQRHLSKYNELLEKVRTSLAQQSAYEEVITQARQVYQARQQVFDLGQGEYLEVLRARRELFELQRRKQQVDYQSFQSLLELLYEQSALNVNFLAELSKTGKIVL